MTKERMTVKSCGRQFINNDNSCYLLTRKSNFLNCILAFLFLFFGTYYAANQIKIEGIILNSETGEPIPYVNIQVLNTNWGTTTNKEGRFELVLKEDSYFLKITHIGYRSRTISIHNSTSNLIIKLEPSPIEFEPIEILSYKGEHSWEELFILKAIKKKNEFLDKLSQYRAFAYSKTSISSVDSLEKLYAFIESISEINFVSPDYYQEKVLNLKMPRILKNYPYEDIGIKLNVDLHHGEVKLQKFSIVSPLHDDALDYYSYQLKGKILQDLDTLIRLELKPKTNQKPLFQGELTFLRDSHFLVEAHLVGNTAVADGFVEYFDFFQRYSLKGDFNIPVFTKIKLRVNLSGLRLYITQENAFVNYLFNDQIQSPTISLDKKIIFEPNIKYAIDKNREGMFHMPLTKKEIESQAKIDSLYTESPFYLKLFLYLISDFTPLIFDKSASIGEIEINKISNWYHFNKVGGHYLGIEYQFLNQNDFNLFGNVGYAFNQKLFEYYFRARYKQFIFESESQIVNFGRFPYNKIYNSLNIIFTHEDPFHYYLSRSVNMTFTQNISTRWNFSCSISIERQTPLSNSTEFSIFNKGKQYTPNYQIGNYWNNGVGFQIDYIENDNYRANNLVVYKGGSFLNASFNYKYNDKLVNSTENRSILDVRIHRLQPIINPISIYTFMSLHLQHEANYIQNMNFLNQFKPLMVEENDLTFFSIKDYNFYVENYLRIKSDINFYYFPNGTSVGCLVSFLRPLSFTNNFESIDVFKQLNKNFVEYGLFVKGLSYFNLYVLLNNIEVKKPMFILSFYF